MTRDPMANMKPPHVPEQPVPVIPPDVVRRLLDTCSGPNFEDRRDADRCWPPIKRGNASSAPLR